MSLTPGQRITLINECATLLDKSDWPGIDLTLGQHGLPTTDYWQGDDRRAYVIDMVKDSSDETLVALHDYLTGESDHSAPGKSPFRGERLRLFLSHLAVHREFVGAVGSRLSQYGVDAFVAHDSIEPSMEWQQVIEAALMDCDAMVVFLHHGFITSKWCDQEVGWAMGRRLPVLPLNFGDHPYGFMGKYQDQPCGSLLPYQIGDVIAGWLVKNARLQTAMAASLTYGFRHSSSWNFTRRLVPLLEGLPSLTEGQLGLMEEAARVNVDVADCDISGTSGPDWVAQFVRERRGPVASDPWASAGSSDEPPF